MPKPIPRHFRQPYALSKMPLGAGLPGFNGGGYGDFPSMNPDVEQNLDFFQKFFATWLKVDPATLAAALTIGSTLMNGVAVVKGILKRMYNACLEFLTASISIPAYDDLNKDILNWIGANVLDSRSPRNLAAKTDDVGNMFTYFKKRKDLSDGKKTPINYLPAFGTVWFVHDRNVFLVRRISEKNYWSNLPQEYVEAPSGNEPLVIMVFGRSISPIRRFLETVRDFADEERNTNVTVRVAKTCSSHSYW